MAAWMAGMMTKGNLKALRTSTFRYLDCYLLSPAVFLELSVAKNGVQTTAQDANNIGHDSVACQQWWPSNMRGYLTQNELFYSAYICKFLILAICRHRSRALHPTPYFALNTIEGCMVCTHGTHT